MKNQFLVKQFEDKPLAHYSYAILSGKNVILIDPQRNPAIYFSFAKLHNAKIIGVIETHPHADFASSHLEIHKTTGAVIYVSKLVDADYPHQTFDEANILKIGDVELRSLNTPGHSPDSISVVLSKSGKDHYVFTGDTLFIEDCGRPDLREKAGHMQAKREELAGQMYDSLRNKLMKLDDDVIVYPAHGAGSLCGKSLSDEDESTIGKEKQTNWSLQKTPKDDFIKKITSDQPFIPVYFGYNVEVNNGGAYDFHPSVNNVPLLGAVKSSSDVGILDTETLIIDTRPQEGFKKSHLPNSINIMNGDKFETWLGSMVKPDEPYYLVAEDQDTLETLIRKSAKIAYEGRIKGAFVLEYGKVKSPVFSKSKFDKQTEAYTIVDIRNYSEVSEAKIFDKAIHIPLNELRERAEVLPKDKPIVVHCAGGYRSAIGSSILEMELKNVEIFDMSEAVKKYE